MTLQDVDDGEILDLVLRKSRRQHLLDAVASRMIVRADQCDLRGRIIRSAPGCPDLTGCCFTGSLHERTSCWIRYVMIARRTISSPSCAAEREAPANPKTKPLRSAAPCLEKRMYLGPCTGALACH